MTLMIPFKKTKSGEIKRVKLGISWTTFFFNYLGIVFFLRGVWSWGVISLIINAIYALVALSLESTESHMVAYVAVFINTWIAVKSNEWTAKFYLNHGYEAYEPESDETRLAYSVWSLHQKLPEGWKPNAKVLWQNSLEHFVFILVALGELFLLYQTFSFVGWADKNLTPKCEAKLTLDTLKKLASDHGVDIYEIRDIREIDKADKKVACNAQALSSKGDSRFTYTVEKLAEGGFYVQIVQ